MVTEVERGGRMRWRRWLVVLVVAGAAASPRALRAGDKHKDYDKEREKDRKRFAKLDHNHDGVVSRVEWKGSREQFERLDHNHDGVISWEEYARARGHEERDERDERFDRLDRNHDGVISRYEWDGDRETFERLDRNHDGLLSREELRREKLEHRRAPVGLVPYPGLAPPGADVARIRPRTDRRA
jgi:Ca2+-binding EF-hand superfamily protein